MLKAQRRDLPPKTPRFYLLQQGNLSFELVANAKDISNIMCVFLTNDGLGGGG